MQRTTKHTGVPAALNVAGGGLCEQKCSVQPTSLFARCWAVGKRPVFALTLAFMCAALLFLSACSAVSSRYNWDNLVYEQGIPVYYENGVATSSIGVDVSSIQGEIDWDAVAADGVEFAMLRCGWRGYTEGNLYVDECFYTNADGCQDAGIPFGVYFFSQATSEEEAIEEADYVLEIISGMNVSYPIAFDLESIEGQASRTDVLSPDELTLIADAFCSRIQEAGYETLVYGNQRDLARYDLDDLNSQVWYAEYEQSYPTSASDDFVMWQYTSTGSVSGIATDVDINILFTSQWDM